MAALMITLFIGSWLPYAVVAMFGIVGLSELVTPYSAELPVMLAKASAIWNPLVYALMHPRYRSALANVLPQWCRVGGDEASSKTSSTRKTYDTQKHQTTGAAVALQEAANIDDIQTRRQIAAASDDGGGDDVHIVWLTILLPNLNRTSEYVMWRYL